jgi:hypothetical protein
MQIDVSINGTVTHGFLINLANVLAHAEKLDIEHVVDVVGIELSGALPGYNVERRGDSCFRVTEQNKTRTPVAEVRIALF